MLIKEQKVNDIRNKLESIILEVDKQAAKGSKLHEVERSLFTNLLSLGFMLLSYYISVVSDLIKEKGTPLDSQGKKMHHTGTRARSYVSIFGRLGISRPKYYSCVDKVHYALDSYLGLPAHTYSYVLVDWMTYNSVDMDFEQSAEQLSRILGQNFYASQSKRLSDRLSVGVPAYYEQQDWSDLDQDETTHLSVGFDGKGIPLIRSATERANQSTSTRLGKGKKRGVKKEATLSVSSSFTSKKRGTEEIIAALFSSSVSETSPKPTKHTWHQDKHIRAFLSDKSQAIRYGFEQALARDKSQQKPIVVLIDGDRSLEKAVKKVVEDKKIEHRMAAYVLDFIHLLEYVWKVANAHLGEKHPGREDWVKKQAGHLLNNQSQKVLGDWKKILEDKTLTPTQFKNTQAAITYLSNHQHMVAYKTYLEKGFPITTGAVESACGHFIKSRMERNAMHWNRDGAQNMLNIRAVKKNNNWDDYLENYIHQEQCDLYNLAA